MKDFFRLRLRPGGLLAAAGFAAAVGSVAGFFGRHAWWLDLASHFRVQYAALFALLAAGLLAAKKPRRAIAWLSLAAINAAPVLDLLLPRRAYDRVDGPSLKAALINVNTQHGHPGRVQSYLERESPDIVILEEINDAWMQRLSAALEHYPARLVETRFDNFGIGFFSRAPVTSTQLVYFAAAGVPSVVAGMELGGEPFALLASHPLPPGGKEYSDFRNEHLRDLADYAQAAQGALILLGDLNVSPWSPHYRDFIRRSGLVNASEGRALHPTWPAFNPLMLIPIDHCLHNRGIAIRSKRVGTSVGSDHFPVLIEFALKPRGDPGQ